MRRTTDRRRPGYGALLIVAACLSLALLAPEGAVARELRWRLLAVEARLAADGVLHVEETHEMLFTGAWNGGERVFSVPGGQRLELLAVERLDPASGEWKALVEGDLGRVDHYDWASGDALRWRSRSPSDPPFDRDLLTYRLTYTLSGLLAEREESYRLNHDFAFPDRAWPIDRFTLDLTIDPAWQKTRSLLDRYEATDLPPGRGFILTADLGYAGEGRPSEVQRLTPIGLRLAIFAAGLLGLGAIVGRFFAAETRAGRFEPVEVPEEPGREWLERHLLRYLPEEIGALWDRKIGAPEVAAVLARLVAEGKLESTVETKPVLFWKRRVLRLERKVELSELDGAYERPLLKKLFFDNRDMVDTDALRKHYSKKGFSPARVIRKPLERRIRRHEELGEEGKKLPRDRLALWLFLAFLVALAMEWALSRLGVLPVIAWLALTTPVPIVVGSLGAVRQRWALDRPRLAAVWWVVPALLYYLLAMLPALAGTPIGVEWSGLAPGPAGVLALALLPLAMTALWSRVGRTRESPERLRTLRRLAAVRRFFQRELARAEPRLEDAWFPYLLAFGLNSQVDRWFRSYGTSAASRSIDGATGAGLGSSGSPSWTGGGGGFGGAGATATWAAAVGGMAAGVTAPSSGSGSSGGSSGGSSSGGGGGGGW